MKNTLILILLFTFFRTSAQIEKPINKGNFIIGGSVSFNSSKTTSNEAFNNNDNGILSTNIYKIKNSNSNYTFSPSLGYFIIKGLAVGITPAFSISNQCSQSSDPNGYSNTSHVHSIGSGVYMKYYFKNGILLNLNAQYLYNKSSINNTNNVLLENNDGTLSPDGTMTSNSNSQYKTLGISPGLGYAIFINSKVSLEILISYSYKKQSGPMSNNSDVNFLDSTNSNQQSISSGSTVNNSNGFYFTITLNKFL